MEEILYMPKLPSSPVRDKFLPHLLMTNQALRWGPGYKEGGVGLAETPEAGVLIRVGSGRQDGVRLPCQPPALCPSPCPPLQAVSTRDTTTRAWRPSDSKRVAAASAAPAR